MIKTIHCTLSDFDIKNDTELILYKLTKIMTDNNYTHRESMENVFSSLRHMTNTTFLYIISCNYQKIDIHLGVLKDKKDNIDLGSIFESSFLGNFYGSVLEKVSNDDYKEFYDSMKSYKRFGATSGFPSINTIKKEYSGNVDFQGIDRLINSSINRKWRIVIAFTPIEVDKVKEIEHNICKYYENIYKDYKLNYQEGRGNSITNNFGLGRSEAVAKTDGWSEQKSTSQNTNTETSNGSKGSGSSTSKSKNSSTSTTTTTSDNSNTYSKQQSTNEGISYERINRTYKKEIDHIDNFLLDRIDRVASRGYFKTNTYILASNIEDLIATSSLYCSIFQGNINSYNILTPYILEFDNLSEINRGVDIVFFHHLNKKHTDKYTPLMSTLENYFGIASFLTTSELSIIAGIPITEVPNLDNAKYVEFGLNINKNYLSSKENCFTIGSLMNKELELKSIEIKLDNSILNKHIFVSGVTGSGKTTTCQTILLESKLPFIVIEPTKTEYRELIGKVSSEDFIIFTVGNEFNSPFRFNPFEILEGENIISHIDMLKASFTNSFHMEAAMPQLLEEAIYRVYEYYGWNIATNENRYTDNPYDGSGMYFPIISDLLVTLSNVVREKNFASRLGSDYIGSLVSRFSNLCIGSKGAILNTRRSIDIMELINKKVIIELEDLKSGDDKALFMSMLISRIAEAIKIKYRKDPTFKHITLIEEAHRLLAKVDSYDKSKKEAVDVFSDLLAEIRKYGESLIIADQIPNKMVPDVLKNTNTKIIHKLFALDDKNSVGAAMMMNDDQKEYLSSLKAGEAIFFSESVNKPVHFKVRALTDTSSHIDEGIVLDKFKRVRDRFDSILSNISIRNSNSISFDVSRKINFNSLVIDLENIIKEFKKTSFNTKSDEELISTVTNFFNQTEVAYFIKNMKDLEIIACEKYNLDIDIIISEIILKFFDRGGRIFTILRKNNLSYQEDILFRFFKILMSDDINDYKEDFLSIVGEIKDKLLE